MANSLPYISTAEVNAFCQRHVARSSTEAQAIGAYINSLGGNMVAVTRGSEVELLPSSSQTLPGESIPWGGDSAEEYDRKWGFRE